MIPGSIKKIFQIRGGYTLVELLVSMSIITIMLSVVLANFRAGQRTNEITVALGQLTDNLNKTRNWAQAGRIDDTGNYPSGGYLLRFDFNFPGSYFIATTSEEFAGSGTSRYFPENLVAKGRIDVTNYRFLQFCGLDSQIVDAAITGLPCDQTKSLKWKPISWLGAGDFVEIGFNQPSAVIANYAGYLAEDNFKYIGGILEQENTGYKAYFYVSLLTGLTGSGRL